MFKRKILMPSMLAVLCAVGVNTVLFTDSGHRLQNAIIESDTTSRAQAHLVASENNLAFKVNVTATKVMKIEGILLYDDESIHLSNPVSTFGSVSFSNEGYPKKISITSPNPISIRKWDTLVSWTITLLLPEARSINLTDVAITMTDGSTLLTTEGTGEF